MFFMERDLGGGPKDFPDRLGSVPKDVSARDNAGGRLFSGRPPLELLCDPEGELDVHVRLDQGPLDVPDDFLDEGLVDVAGARDLAERLAEGAAEFFEDHRTPPKNGGTLSLAVRTAHAIVRR